MTSRAKEIMGYSFLVVFANDSTIDEAELAFLEKLALEDGVVDDEERAVLQNIFARVDEQSVTPEVWEEIRNFKAKYQVS